MKQLIILIAMIALGVSVFNMIAGDHSSSIYSSVKALWKQEVTVNQKYP